MKTRHRFWLMAGLVGAQAHAAGGPLGIDHEWHLDERGIWARNVQTDLEVGVAVVEIGGAFWLGSDSDLGHTLFQSLDSTAISSIAAQGLKLGVVVA